MPCLMVRKREPRGWWGVCLCALARLHLGCCNEDAVWGGSEQHCRFPPLAQGAMWSVRVPPHWLLTSQSRESSWGLWALWYKDANPFWTLPRDLATTQRPRFSYQSL